MLIALEGTNGAGKTTLAKGLMESGELIDPISIAHPGTTELGKILRSPCRGLSPWENLDPLTVFLLLAADFRQANKEIIEPAIKQGRDIVCDRYLPSSYVYQGPKVGIDVVTQIFGDIMKPVTPDLTVLLHGDPIKFRERSKGDSKYENEPEESIRNRAEFYKFWTPFLAGAEFMVVPHCEELSKEKILREVLEAIKIRRKK